MLTCNSSVRAGPIDFLLCSAQHCPSRLPHNFGTGALEWLPEPLGRIEMLPPEKMDRLEVRLMLEAVCEPEAVMAASDPPAADTRRLLSARSLYRQAITRYFASTTAHYINRNIAWLGQLFRGVDAGQGMQFRG